MAKKTDTKPTSKKNSKDRAQTKAEIVTTIATRTSLSKTQVEGVLHELADLAKSEIRQARPFKLAGLVSMKVAERPARPARSGRNPKNGETIEIPAKPARKVVRARPDAALRGLF